MPFELRVETALSQRLRACKSALVALSSFQITRPPDHGAGESRPDPHGPASPLPDPLIDILVIDDDRDTRVLLERVGTAAGYVVDHAPSGSVGLDMVAAAAPRLVLLDVHMPECDGRAVADRLRALPAPQRPAILLMTADPELLARDSAIPVLAKPFDLAGLLDRLATLLGAPRH